MTENKTKVTQASVESFIMSLPGHRRDDAKALVKLMQSVSRQKPRIWGSSIIGFGSCHYRYDSGREGFMPLICFSPRKSANVVYAMGPAEKPLLERLGKHALRGSCLHIKKLSDVDPKVLRTLVAKSFAKARAQHANQQRRIGQAPTNLKLIAASKSAIIALLFFLSAMMPAVSAQGQDSSAAEMDELKAQVRSQEARIQALESALAEQQKLLASVIPHRANGTTLVSAVGHSEPNLKAEAYTVQVQGNLESTQDQQPLAADAQVVEDELQRGPEIADVTPNTPALKLGPAKIRLIGYAALTGFYRSTNAGGNTATNFVGIPFDNTVAGNTSEFRFSAQNSRLALRADADLKTSKVAGYFEMNFLGLVPGNVPVTPTNYGPRLRQAWFNIARGKWELTGGQLFTLMTPVKKSILPWPGDVSITQVIDQNFVAGLVWGRYPQVRAVYHYSDAASFAFSAENPEQQVGGGVVFPTVLAPILSTQYNVGTNGLAVPNATPDFIGKGSFDGKLGSHATHLDVGGVMRVFRNFAPAQGSGVSDHHYAFGGGGNVNATFEVATGYRLVVNAFAGSGAGRYIGGLVPDVIVRANGEISPIKSYSWVGGLEIAPNRRTGLYVYYSGVYGEKNVAVDTNGNFIGWGYPGASNAADRSIQELTPGFSRTFWRHESLGSVQLGFQYAYVFLHPWVAGTGPGAHIPTWFSGKCDTTYRKESR